LRWHTIYSNLENSQIETLACRHRTRSDHGGDTDPDLPNDSPPAVCRRHDKDFTYSRAGNPTVSALENRLAALEGAEYATCYSPGSSRDDNVVFGVTEREVFTKTCTILP